MEHVQMIENTGIVRKVDELGRIVLPIETRAALGIKERDGLQIFIDAVEGICGTRLGASARNPIRE
mgnify:CR=1 FL=1